MNRLITSVLCSLVTIGSVIYADPTRPRLVVGIVVDQLRTDYIEYLQSLFCEKGFRRLMNDGAYLRNVDFRTMQPDGVSATAMLYTGNFPSQTGVPSASVYDESRGKMMPVLARDNSFTPQALLLSTISDELAIDGIGLGSIYSLSTDPQQAVVMAGHAGNGAAWISDITGRWEAAPYYGKLPIALANRNTRFSVDRQLDTIKWEPLLHIEKYPGLPGQKKYYPYKYSFSRGDHDAFRKYLSSPLANREVTSAAIDYIEQMHLGGKPQTIDMLNIGYTAAPYKYVRDGDYRLELQDTYLRLDRDLGRLLDAIDKCVGLDNTLIYLSSTGYYDDATPDAERYRIPSGNFSVKRALSLLNSFLSATYGPGDYVGGYAGGHFFLNDKLIADRRLEAGKVVSEARDFLSKMAGIAEAYTLDDILSGGDATLTLRNSIDVKRGGDIYVLFKPGWTVTDDSVYPPTVKNVRYSAVATPFMMMGANVTPQVIGTPVDATAIAPTVTQTLRIRAPNGAPARPLLLSDPATKSR